MWGCVFVCRRSSLVSGGNVLVFHFYMYLYALVVVVVRAIARITEMKYFLPFLWLTAYCKNVQQRIDITAALALMSRCLSVLHVTLPAALLTGRDHAIETLKLSRTVKEIRIA